jgi:hypothetical protein
LRKALWTYVSDDEAAEIRSAAAARGMKDAALLRHAVLTFIRQPAGDTAPQQPVSPVVARLEAVAATLERLVPTLDDAWQEHEAVRGSLRDIATAVGTIAGAIEAVEPPS